jgi:hypothetical protein
MCRFVQRFKIEGAVALMAGPFHRGKQADELVAEKQKVWRCELADLRIRNGQPLYAQHECQLRKNRCPPL